MTKSPGSWQQFQKTNQSAASSEPKIALKPKEVRTREQALESPARRGSGEGMQPTCARENGFFLLSCTPLSCGHGSKAHIVEQCDGSGGETVYVSGKYPLGISAEEYKRLPDAVYVRGEARHPDHETITLNG